MQKPTEKLPLQSYARDIEAVLSSMCAVASTIVEFKDVSTVIMMSEHSRYDARVCPNSRAFLVNKIIPLIPLFNDQVPVTMIYK